MIRATEEILKIDRLELHTLTTSFKIRKIAALPFLCYPPNRHYGWYFWHALSSFCWHEVANLGHLEITGKNEENIVSLIHFRSLFNCHPTYFFFRHLIVYFSLLSPLLIWIFYTHSKSLIFDFFEPSSLLDADCSQLKFFPDKFLFTSKSLFQNWNFPQTKSVLAVKLFFLMLLNHIFFLSCKICRDSQKLSLCTVSFSAIGPIKNTTMPEALFCWTTVQHSLSLDQIGINTQCSFKVITLSLKFSYLLPWSDALSWDFLFSLS